MKRKHFVIIGAGCSGLTLASSLVTQLGESCFVTLIERERHAEKSERNWSFWFNGQPKFPRSVRASWEKIHFHDGTQLWQTKLDPYRWYLVSAKEYTENALALLRQHSNVSIVHDTVAKVKDGKNSATVTTSSGKEYEADWVFDSAFSTDDLPEGKHTLYMHTSGWEVSTARPVFKPYAATVFDFRSGLEEGMFFYTLPLNRTRASVEMVWVNHSQKADSEKCKRALKQYLEDCIDVGKYQLHHEQDGVIPLLPHKINRRQSPHVMSIGMKGGLVRSSTGYGIKRIWDDSDAIAQSLKKYGHPFSVPSYTKASRLSDRLMSHIFSKQPKSVPNIFIQLFSRMPAAEALKFLDDDQGELRTLLLMTRIKPLPFFQALFSKKRATPEPHRAGRSHLATER